MSFTSKHQDSRRDVGSARPWVALTFLSMLQFVIAIDVTVVNIALPSIGADLGVQTRQLTWVVVAYTITGGGLLMLGGRLADLFGRRRVLIVGTWIFGGASLLAGLAPSFEWLVTARLLQGVGEALILPAAMASIIMLFPEGPRRSKALGIWAAVASSGLVVGFVMSGVITELFGWRWIFLVTVPFIAIALIAVVTFVPRVMEKAGPAVVARTGITSTALSILYFATTAWFGASAPILIPAMLLIAVGMGFGLVGLQYAAVSGVTEENAGIASGIQRASDQLGGAVGVALYIGLGFSPLMARFGDPFIIASLMATTGLVLAGLLTRGIGRAETADDPAEDATA